eukprot:m.6097 g.6097  ORF g.6097 m.6097 type:complete len:66 (-) comp4638_c0_seq1:119-316(-)
MRWEVEGEMRGNKGEVSIPFHQNKFFPSKLRLRHLDSSLLLFLTRTFIGILVLCCCLLCRQMVNG